MFELRGAARRLLSVIAMLALPVAATAQDDAAKLAKFKAIAKSDTMLPMSDGVGLATDVHLPKGEGPFPVIFVHTPHDFTKLQDADLDWAIEAVERGYAYVVQAENRASITPKPTRR